MGFLSDFNVVKEFIKANNSITELKDLCIWGKEEQSNIRRDVFNLEREVKELAEKKEILKKEISNLEEQVIEWSEKKDEIFYIKGRDFLDFLNNRGYEFYKLEIEEEPLFDQDCKYFYPIFVKRIIDVKIQEFSAAEGFDFIQTRELLYKVNGAWSEVYEQLKSEGKVENNSVLCSTSLGFVLLNFMMIRKKENDRNVLFDEISDETNNKNVEVDKMFK